MSVFQVIRIELIRMWRNRIMRLALFALSIIPLMYSSLYLFAFWNPYGHLNKLPVALVNEDTGGVQNGKTVNFGKNFTKTLLDDASLDWTQTSYTTAMNGLKQDKYYMVLKIPTQFTNDLLSAGKANPEKAQLDFIPNQGRNYLAGLTISRVQDDIVSSVSNTFSKQYITTLLTAVGKQANGLSTVATNANKLSNGANQLATGATSVANGASKLSTGSTSLANGASQAKSGADQLVVALSKITPASGTLVGGLAQANQATEQLSQGIEQLSNGGQQLQGSSQTLANGTAQAASAAGQLASGMQSAAGGSQQIATGLTEASGILQKSAGQDANANEALQILQQLLPASQNLTTSLGKLQGGTTQLGTSLGKIQSGQSQLTSGIGQLGSSLTKEQQGLNQLGTAQNQLLAGANQLHQGLLAAAAGAQSLQTGIGKLQSGATNLANGASTLSSGATNLASGAKTLASNEQTFANKVSNAAGLAQIPNSSNQASMMANPIQAVTHAIYPMDKYGPGLAPYFVPLSLWVGSLMLFFLVSLREGRWRISPVSGPTVILGKLGVLWIIGSIQAIIASTIILYGLGLSIENVAGFYLFNMFCSITYVTLIALFIALLGSSPGRFIGIALLVLQLTSAAGTYPLELLPSLFQHLHPILPMSYAVVELRNLIAIHSSTTAWHAIGTTALYWIVSVVLLCVWSLRKVSARELRVPDELVS